MSSPAELGKPGGGADILAGIRTAPLILAARQSPSLTNMLEEDMVDSREIVRIVREEGGLELAREVASNHADEALKAIVDWKESTFKNDLKDIVKICINRTM